MKDEKIRKILPSLLFDIFKYNQDPKGIHNFNDLRQFYRELSLEAKKRITRKALVLDPEMEEVVNRKMKHKRKTQRKAAS